MNPLANLKKRGLALGVKLALCVAIGLLLNGYLIHIVPTYEDAQVSGQILADFESMARTNVLFHRTITRRQQRPEWADRHVEIGTSSRHKFTQIHVLGDLNEGEEDVLRSIATKLQEHYSRRVELRFDRLTSNIELNESTNAADVTMLFCIAVPTWLSS